MIPKLQIVRTENSYILVDNVFNVLAEEKDTTLSVDDTGREHKGKGEGGGQFVGKDDQEQDDIDWLKENGTIGDIQRNVVLANKGIVVTSPAAYAEVNTMRRMIVNKVKTELDKLRQLHATGKVWEEKNDAIVSSMRIYVQQRNKPDNGYIQIKSDGSRDYSMIRFGGGPLGFDLEKHLKDTGHLEITPPEKEP